MTINRNKLQVVAEGIDTALGNKYHQAEWLFYSVGKTLFDSPPTHSFSLNSPRPKLSPLPLPLFSLFLHFYLKTYISRFVSVVSTVS